MKRNLILTVLVAASMLASQIAWAADVSFSGQFRPRFNIDEDASGDTNTNTFTDVRVRLNAKTNVNANTEVFLQFQSVGTWGATATNAEGTRVSEGGGAGTGAGAQASDLLQDVGFHQAYMILKNFGGYGADAKIGRQEVVIDGHRLFGHTGWTQGAETKDALRLTHAAGNHTLNYSWIKALENDANATLIRQDDDVHVFHAATQGVLGGALTGIFTITDDDAASNSAAFEDNETWYTVGARQKGKAAGFDYRVEFYHQFGDAGGIAATCACGVVDGGAINQDGNAADRDAQMFGLRIGKTFKNALWSPTVTLWYDSLTGVDDDDASVGDWGQFDTMYDTGHKFYGFQDFFLARTGSGTGFYGLEDYAIKFKGSPRPGWTAKMDWHHFRTQTDLDDGDSDTVRTADANIAGVAVTNPNELSSDLGTEVDLTLIHKYDANTKLVFGYSHYWTTDTFGMVNGGAAGNGGTVGANNNDDSDWAYVQVDTKF